MIAPVNVTIQIKIATISIDFVKVVPPLEVEELLLKNPGSNISVNICHIPAPIDLKESGAAE